MVQNFTLVFREKTCSTINNSNTAGVKNEPRPENDTSLVFEIFFFFH